MIWDTHLHTSFSGDSDARPSDMAEQACRLGLKGICITDHLDPDYPDEPELFMLDLPAYDVQVHRLAESFCGRLPIRFGLEFGLQPHLGEYLHRTAQQFPFDFIIGSSHVVNGMDPYYPAYYEGRSERDAYMEYFESILKNLQTCRDFDVYGHIDYVVRYGPDRNTNYSYREYSDILDEILCELIHLGKGIEINTAGFKYGLGHPNPEEDIIRRYRELGGEIITIGADGHSPDTIAWDFARVPDILKSCGFRYYTVFQNRQPEFIPLP